MLEKLVYCLGGGFLNGWMGDVACNMTYNSGANMLAENLKFEIVQVEN